MKVQTHFNLAEYIRRGNQNTEGLLSGTHPLIPLVETYDEFFANQLWADEQHQANLPMFLSLNAYTLWTSAVRMALTGHEAAVYPLLRTAVESACYALVITRNPQLGGIWSARHDGEGERKAARKAFTPAVGDAAVILEAFEPGLGGFVLQLYDACIDFGAHPNTRGVMNHVHGVPREGEQEEFGLGSIYPGDSLQVFRALVAVIEAGRGISMLLVCCLPTVTEAVADAVREIERQQNELLPPLPSS
jgi:hypothetical protein